MSWFIAYICVIVLGFSCFSSFIYVSQIPQGQLHIAQVPQGEEVQITQDSEASLCENEKERRETINHSFSWVILCGVY